MNKYTIQIEFGEKKITIKETKKNKKFGWRISSRNNRTEEYEAGRRMGELNWKRIKT